MSGIMACANGQILSGAVFEQSLDKVYGSSVISMHIPRNLNVCAPSAVQSCVSAQGLR
ncbi:hypothetical protein FIBSPDRAFT_876392, partial [Athelia psychrophila]